MIPLPNHITPGQGAFPIDASTRLWIPPGDAEAARTAEYLSGLWQRTNHLKLAVTERPAVPTGRSIEFRREPGMAPEAYRLDVSPAHVIVSASTAVGLFYGAVTLWQLLPVGGTHNRVPAQLILDEPRYPWRGLMLDSARHFQSPAFVRSMIDWMAWHKLNVLHWHLTDDQGWRLQIRKYPKLTTIGAWRIPAAIPGTVPPPRYGGFYTQDDVRAIVAFAAARHVQIVPEIDMPGHATAAIAAYPSLGVDKNAMRVSAKWGVHTHLFNLDPSTFDFLDDVLTEVAELFPSPFIHVGGDEVVKAEWTASPTVRSRMDLLGIHDASEIQGYFTQEIGRRLAAHGKRLIGWDEILRPGLSSDAVVMSWHGVSGAHAAALAGNDTVLTPQPILYFDRRQSTLASEPPGRIELVSLEQVYNFKPDDRQLDAGQARHVLGVQANIWTEHIQTEARVEWMALPRAAALAEVAWSREHSWPAFLSRLPSMFERYRTFHLNYADSVFGIRAAVARRGAAFEVALNNPSGFTDSLPGEIHYTTDGHEPSAADVTYRTPVTVPAGTVLRAATFVGGDPASRSISVQADRDGALRRDSHQLELCSDRVGLLLEPRRAADQPPLAVDIMNPCWIARGVELSSRSQLIAAVAPLPYNYELGADEATIKVGDARSAQGELEIHVDGCDAPAAATVPLTSAALQPGVTVLPPKTLSAVTGRHDLCLRFARPRLDPIWALDWIEVTP